MRGGRVSLSLLMVVLVLGGSELAVRAVSSKLQPPLLWVNREAQNKAVAMDALRRSKGGASVVFVGSSMTNAAADPALATRLLGVKRPAFNAALDGADLRALEFWTLRVVVPKLRPRAVVIGVSSREFNETVILRERERDGTCGAWWWQHSVEPRIPLLAISCRR